MKTVQISIPDELESRLVTLACERGISVGEFILRLAWHELDSSGDRLNTQTEASLPEVTPEVEAARARLLTAPVRPLPPGKDLLEALEGLWPGTETDEEIREALDRMS